MRWAAGLFLVAHGVLHALIWGVPSRGDVPFDAHRSPLLGDVRVASTLLGVAAGVLFVVAGGAFLAGASWWPYTAVAAALTSLLLLVLTFTPWWLAALAIDVVVVWLSVRWLVGG